MLFKKRPPRPERHSRIAPPTVRSNAVFSYHANRSVREGGAYRDAGHEEAASVPRRRLKASWRQRLPNLAILTLVVVMAVFCMQLSSDVKLEAVGTSGGQLFLRDKKIYSAAAQEAFNSLVNRNKLTVNTEKIASDLRRQFPELQAVTVALPIIGTQPRVFIQPAVPKLILITSTGMYVVDTDGRALISGNQVAKLGDLHIPAVTDESGLGLKTGELALPKATVSFITEVVGQLQAQNLPLASITLPVGGNDLQVRLDKTSYYVKFNVHGNAREEAGAFIAVKQFLEGQKKQPRDYLDVRVDNKVYYQ